MIIQTKILFMGSLYKRKTVSNPIFIYEMCSFLGKTEPVQVTKETDMNMMQRQEPAWCLRNGGNFK
jgi:hypothetical protein